MARMPASEEPRVATVDTEPGDTVQVMSGGEVVEVTVRTKQTVRGAYGSVVLLGARSEDGWVTVVVDPVKGSADALEKIR